LLFVIIAEPAARMIAICQECKNGQARVGRTVVKVAIASASAAR
jgi:hypothetical protein